VRRIPLDDALRSAAKTPEKAVRVLQAKLHARRRRWRLWRNGFEVDFDFLNTVRVELDSRTNRAVIVPVTNAITLRGPLRDILKRDAFELDADQIERERPKPRGPPAKWREKIPQAMRSRECQRLETDTERVAHIRRHWRWGDAPLPQDDRPILAEIQKPLLRNQAR
jgi:hypothetical protein